MPLADLGEVRAAAARRGGAWPGSRVSANAVAIDERVPLGLLRERLLRALKTPSSYAAGVGYEELRFECLNFMSEPCLR